jgi:DNA repair protein SbcC/Rad50
MRPHLLRFQGIGPYPDLVEIDFEKLTPLGLYLIVGPTGAGKSTIFDALSFALYGVVPSGRSIVSDHEHRKSPMIELEFSHRDIRYLVHREPGLPQTATRKATDPKPNAQRFTKFFASGAEESTVTGSKEVTRHVEELLGLKMDQFKRVVLIPQNEFQEFLLAPDKDKSDILDALFGTEIYRKFADKLSDEAEKLKNTAQRAETLLNQKFANINAAVESLIEQELLDATVDAQENLPALISQIVDLAKHADSVEEVAAQVLAQTNAAKALADNEAERFDAFHELQRLRIEFDANAPYIDAAQADLDRHQQAQKVITADNESIIAEDNLDGAKAKATLTRTTLNDLVSSGTFPVLTTFASLVETATPSQLVTELSRVNNIIEGAAQLYKSYNQDRSDLQVASEAARNAKRLLSELQKHQNTLRADIELSRSTEENSVKALQEEQPLREQVVALDALLQRADVEGVTTELAGATVKRDKTGKAFQAANDALTQARQLQSLHMAGELARDLLPEKACPVCGSTEHPALAQPADEASTDELQIAYDAANNANALAENAVREATAALAVAQSEFAKLPSAKIQAELREKLVQTSALAALAGSLKSEIKKLDADLVQVSKTITEQTIKLNQSEADITRLTKQMNSSLDAASKIMAEDTFDIIQPVVGRATELLDVLIDTIDAIALLEGAAFTKFTQYKQALSDNSFSDSEAAASALLTDDKIANLKLSITEFSQLHLLITGLTGKVGDQPVANTRPNLEEAEAAQHQAREHHQTVSTTSNAYDQNLKIIKSAQAEIDTLGPETLELIQNSKDANYVAQVMKTGKAPLLSVQRWVQKQMFIDVCDVATQQLQILSNHRFEILLNDGDTKQGQSLEVSIRDSYTGQVRPVKSMSGGEKFLTSLAMALALAEVVQRMSGGVEITSLFIDEGFGSLDGLTLDTVIDVLQKLQSGGRTIGVISHVEQMIAELDIGIAITPGVLGSTLTVLPGR